ncbi:helix-turn-helix domain-containing protein [Nonomuraea purpurea]|uniref:Helix-turn-helix domain-containing protein n=1 Tax=Nonomuraea purpurea TaxID=1849276 RepID=A0ABV8G563_9ACTN
MSRRPHSPKVRLRQLARVLRDLREEKGMTREQVADATEMNRATLYRIEMAQARPQVRTLRALLDVYGVAEARRAELVALLKAANEPGWLQTAADLPPQYATYIGFEQEARRVLNYETSFIPGLLQTEAYARAAIPGGAPELPREEVENRVRARMQRQARREPPLALWAIIDEAAIHRRVGGPAVMREQLQRLLEESEQSHLTLQLVPFAAGVHPGMHGSFVILQFSEEHHDVVYIESTTSDLFLEGVQDVARYNLVFEHLRAVAASPDVTYDLVAEALTKIK